MMHAIKVFEQPTGCICVCRCQWRSERFQTARGWVPGGRDYDLHRANVAGADHLRAAYS